MTTYPEADQSPNLLTGAGDRGWYRNSGIAAGSVITARSNVGYIVKTVDCRFYKLRMTGYADASGAAGHPQFDLKELQSEEIRKAVQQECRDRSRMPSSA
eukprot:TRINITY_DN9991_c0_g1_i1.p2 TRINITY_DN9991_c0_g1~~TRINITY_DN9991_c0_g1_i1.p2  ORF type:complete len:100 (+),score=26.22 TRINITY_DN9991_c0_g1_i1:228-527(+)